MIIFQRADGQPYFHAPGFGQNQELSIAYKLNLPKFTAPHT